MFYIFENGLIVTGKENLLPEMGNKYIEVEILPDIPQVESKVGYIRGCNVNTGEILFGYSDIPEESEPEPISPEPPEPPLPPESPESTNLTETELTIMAALAENYEQQSQTQENQLAIMAALAEMYELQNGGGSNA